MSYRIKYLKVGANPELYTYSTGVRSLYTPSVDHIIESVKDSSSWRHHDKQLSALCLNIFGNVYVKSGESLKWHVWWQEVEERRCEY